MTGLKIISIFVYTILVFVFGIIFNDLTSFCLNMGLSYGFFIGILFTLLIVMFAFILTEWIYKNDFKWLDIFLKLADDYKYKTFRKK